MQIFLSLYIATITIRIINTINKLLSYQVVVYYSVPQVLAVITSIITDDINVKI